MDQDKPRVDELYLTAAEKPTDEERADYLDQACAGDEELRQRVERLLRARPKMGSFLESPAPEFAPTVTPCLAESSGTVIGPYKLLEQIGEGGFGIVYMADRQAPVRRRVALKIIKPGMDTKQVLARFKAELQALSLMDHPNIARALDAGATDSGRPYFVMELVRGVPITEYCDQNHLAVHERLDLFVQVCQAVQHAHQKGIIHRDIKPSNVLVTLNDGRPVPKVIDFGVAKAIDRQLTPETIFTRFAEMIGTPLYMSPEQAEMTSLDIDTRSDIYSLGVLLYELLTGTTPFEKDRLKQAAFDEIRRIIREEEPAKPSTRISTLGANSAAAAAHRHVDPRHLSQLMRGDLDWIVMKALEKDRTRRYETANGLAMDIRRHLSDEPVEAGPPSAAYRFHKFARRNRAALAMLAAITVALLLGIVGTTWQAIQAMSERDRAVTARTAEAAQRQIADDSRREAERQRQQADANFLKACQAVDDYFNTVSESRLLDMPGLEPLRKELLESALKYYESFIDQHGDDPSRQADLAAAHMRVAQIIYWNGGHLSRIVPHNEKAIEILERLIREGRDTREVQQRMAGFFRGNPEARNFEQGKPFDMSVHLRCLERFPLVWEKFVRDNPDVPEFQNDLAGTHFYLALTQNKLGKFQEASNSSARAIAIWEKLVQSHPREPRYRLNLALIHEGVGIAYSKAGLRDPARNQILKTLSLREQVVSEFPHVAGYRTWLGISYKYAGDVAANPEEAEQDYAKAVEQFEKVVAEFPTMRSCRKDLAGAELQLADTMTKRGKHAEALKLYRQCVNLFEALGAESPDTLTDPGYLSNALYKLSRLLKATGQQQEADEAFRKARDSLPNDPNNAGQLNGQAWVLATSQDEQVRDAKWAVELARKAVELAPQAGYIWNTLGVAQYRAGDWKAAIAALEKSMELRNGGDSVDWFFLGMAHWQTGNRELANKWRRLAVLWTDKHGTNNEQLSRFRAEAASLMGLPETDPMDKTDEVALGELLVELRPQASSYLVRAEAFANSEQWDRALDDFAKAIELGDKNFLAWYERALVRLVKDDKPGFQAACADMLKQLAQTEEEATAHFVAWTCALGPDALNDFAPAVALAAKAAKIDAKSAQYATGVGAILYRAGRFDEARQKLEEADRLSISGDSRFSTPAYTWFFLAMTHHRLKHADEAKKWFDKAVGNTDEALRGHDAGKTKLAWNRRLTLSLLRREAAQLLGVKQPPVPETKGENKPATEKTKP